jgi:farnesyl-diphosphate farnesyltransferase
MSTLSGKSGFAYGRRQIRAPKRPSATSGDAAVFCRDMLLKTSRTFALTIPMLPSPLNDIVSAGYLLCRVADTIEDEGDIAASVRGELLRELETLVTLPPDWRESSTAFAERTCCLLDAGAGTLPHELSLMAGLPILLNDLAGRPRSVRELIHTCVHDMTIGMAKVAARQEARPDQLPIADTDELLEYCDIVAGTVGEMLTGLFTWHSDAAAAVLPALEPRAAAFGRALQLTNIIKDVVLDAASGRQWLPSSILADCGVDTQNGLPETGISRRAVLQQILAVAQREFIEALSYVDALPVTDKSIRRFCVAQLLMAQLTLRKAWEAPDEFATGPVKISRNAVKATLATTSIIAARPTLLDALFGALRAPLPSPTTLPSPALRSRRHSGPRCQRCEKPSTQA